MNTNGDVKSNGRIDTDDAEEDGEAGPELPPDDDDADDEEGRFFGGGITADTADVLDFIDERGKNDIGVQATSGNCENERLTECVKEPEKIDSAWVRRLALNFEKRISKNSELRAKFEDTPEKYVQDLCLQRWVLSDLLQIHELRSRFRCGCESVVYPLRAPESL